MKYRNKATQKEMLLSDYYAVPVTGEQIPAGLRNAMTDMTVAQLHAIGIETITEVYPALTPSQKHGGLTETASGMNITRTYSVVNKTAADILAENVAHNMPINAQLAAADIKIIRALTEGDTVRINNHKAAQAILRATLL